MSAIPDEAIQAVVVPTCGALLITLVFSAIFFGITVLQTYIYYDKYWDDRAYLKTFVIVLALLDMAHMATVIDSVWFYVVSHFGDLSLLDTFSPGILAETATTVTIGLLVQCFFAMRVWLTNDRKVMIPMLIVVLSGAQFALGIYFASIPPVDQNLLFFPQLSWVPISGLCCGLAADVLITISLCYNLHKIRSGIRRADKVVNIVIMYTVNTGLLTSIIAVLSIILSNTSATTFWPLLPFCLISKCYVNSVLAILNSRNKLRNMPSGVTLDIGPLQLTDIIHISEVTTAPTSPYDSHSSANRSAGGEKQSET